MVNRSHAVVIGASFAGLLAASVLRERYDRVTVYDRDVLPEGPAPRKGVPQSRQAHALAAGGLSMLTELLPGFRDDMIAAGGVLSDMQRDIHWYMDGYHLKTATSGLISMGMTRPAIEGLVRARVAALGGVSIVDGTDVTGLLAADGRVRGVSVGSERPETVAADLVVDAAGRGSRAVTWLGDLGYPVPGESQVRAGVVYVTRYYTADPGQLGGRVATLIAPYPGKPRGGGVIRQEGNTFCVFFCGMVGDEPALDDEGLLAFAGSLDNQDVAEVMRESEPLGEAVKMRYPVSRRRHYEKLDRYLGGFLVAGDAMCSFNPIYGQGISAAALEALELRRLLAASRDDADLPRRYFRGIAKVTGQAWTTSTSGDLRFPQAEGRRSPADRLINAYLDRYRAAAVIDPELGLAFLRVANMIDPPARLLAPARVVRVLRSAGKGRRFSGQAR